MVSIFVIFYLCLQNSKSNCFLYWFYENMISFIHTKAVVFSFILFNDLPLCLVLCSIEMSNVPLFIYPHNDTLKVNYRQCNWQAMIPFCIFESFQFLPGQNLWKLSVPRYFDWSIWYRFAFSVKEKYDLDLTKVKRVY